MKIINKAKLIILGFSIIMIVSFKASYAAPFQKIIIPEFLKNIEKPAYLQNKKFIAPKVKKHFLSLNHKIYSLNNSELPLINISLIFNGGDILLNKNEVSLFSLLSSTLNESGGKKYPGHKLQEVLDFHGIRFSIHSSLTHLTVSASFLKKDFPLVMDIISDILKNPVYNNAKLESNKFRKIEGIKRRNSSPARIARRKLKEILYKNSVLGASPSIAGVKKIKINRIEYWHKKVFNPANLDILISGDIKGTAYLAKFKSLLANLPGQKKSYKKIIQKKILTIVQNSPYAKPAKELKNYYFFVPKKLPQSSILIASFAMAHNSKDYHSAKIMNFILGGGGFNSRYFREIRSNKGLAYSVYSYFAPSRDYGIWKSFAQTKNSSTLEVLDLMQTMSTELAVKDVSSAELEWAKQSQINKFVFIFEKTNEIVNQVYSLEQEKLSEDFLMSFNKIVSNISKKDIRKQAEKYLIKMPKIIVIVGDKDTVLKKLKEKYLFKIISLETSE